MYISSFQILTREFQPVKPHPAAVLHIASKWNINPQNMMMIGDDKQDILCGSSAGTSMLHFILAA